MRTSPPWILAAVIAGCRPSATVVKTTPVASLQSYRTVGRRGKSTAFASQGQAMFLEQASMFGERFGNRALAAALVN